MKKYAKKWNAKVYDDNIRWKRQMLQNELDDSFPLKQ